MSSQFVNNVFAQLVANIRKAANEQPLMLIVTLFLPPIFILLQLLMPKDAPKPAKPARFNTSIKLDEAKVVDKVNVDKTEKKVLCRCWKSKNFPYCDGSHAKYNEETGDNLGPVIINPDGTVAK